MEDHSGNIIYIIAVIIAVISSIVSKVRKTADKNQDSPASPQKSWQDVIREMTMEQEPQATFEPDPELKHIPSKKVEVKPFLNSESDIHREKMPVKTSIATTPKVVSNFEEEGSGSVSMPDFSNYDEIKRGIIFNEIFTRRF